MRWTYHCAVGAGEANPNRPRAHNTNGTAGCAGVRGVDDCGAQAWLATTCRLRRGSARGALVVAGAVRHVLKIPNSVHAHHPFARPAVTLAVLHSAGTLL